MRLGRYIILLLEASKGKPFLRMMPIEIIFYCSVGLSDKYDATYTQLAY